MNSTTIPFIRYRNAEKAIDWLHKAFGFEVFLKVDGEEHRIEHARLTLETNMIMLASIGRPSEEYFKLPVDVGGVTQGILMVVTNPDRIYETSVKAGAKITVDIADSRFGGRGFSCEDIESHVWVFGSQSMWEKLW